MTVYDLIVLLNALPIEYDCARVLCNNGCSEFSAPIEYGKDKDGKLWISI